MFDIRFSLSVKSNEDGSDIIFDCELVKMRYDRKDIRSACDFIHELGDVLVNPIVF